MLLLPTDTTMEAIKDLNASRKPQPDFYPCVVPPVIGLALTMVGITAHQAADYGGTDNHNYLSELKHFDMPQVYGAVNAMQRTASR